MASLSATPVSDWSAACATIISNSNISTGLVGQYGNPVSELNNFTWGIDKETCFRYCGKDKIYQDFDFNNFANSFTNWLLPWLALAAQLPFEARSSVGNLMSLFMAVGSPALITYSLTLTILNRIWVRRIFESLLEQLDGSINIPQDSRGPLRKRLHAAQYLLQESQQVPMRTSQVHGWLSSLIVLDKNEKWWMRVKKDLQNSRRGYTFSLFAQIGMAFIAYTFTIATTLNSSPLGDSEGSGVLLTAGGGIWIWMIPVIMGWIMCGTQARALSITEAVNDKTHPVFRADKEGEAIENEVQYGIRSRSGLIPRPRPLELPTTLQSTLGTPAEIGSGAVTGSKIPDGTQVARGGKMSREIKTLFESSESDLLNFKNPLGDFPLSCYQMLKVQSWIGFSIEGDEAREGPLFNYARLFTFREFSLTITNAFAAHLASFEADPNRKTNIVEVAESCKLDKYLLQAYTPRQEIGSTVWHHMLIGAGAAIFVQWGTTGPAVMIAYLTPTVGLGCRSGGYLIYGIAATISWALLICSFFLSHAVNLRYQDIYMQERNCNSRKKYLDLEDVDESKNPGLDNLSMYRRTLWHSTLAFLTVATRATGKLIAAANACWIVTSAIFEYTGVYDSCWCEADADMLGNRAWVVLFVTPQTFQTVAKNFWIGGVIFSYGVCFLAYVGFFLGCKRSDIDVFDG